VAPNDDRLKAHLQTDDFFDTANHPTATFVSRSVTVAEDDANEATVVGDLTLRGVTRPVTIEVEFNQAGTAMGVYKAGFDGEATIKRSEFGINYALPAVSDEVKLHIEGEFNIVE
jgi:polyisoprenoid-binding protein YceI